MQQIDRLEQEQESIRTLYSWLMGNNARFQNVAVEIVSPGNRNVVCTKPIIKGETVVFIPKSRLIFHQSIEDHPIIKKITQLKIKFNSPKHTQLALFLLYQKQNELSDFKPYIDMLPQDLNNFPVFYTEQQMAELEGSPICEAIEKKKTEIQDDMKIANSSNLGMNVTFNEFCWARTVVCSRIFGIHINGKRTDVMAPFADLLNHSVNKQVSWMYSDEKEGFIMEALTDIKKGVEVCDSYGRKSNLRFLINYGFVPADNQQDNQLMIKFKTSKMFRDKGLDFNQIEYPVHKLPNIPTCPSIDRLIRCLRIVTQLQLKQFQQQSDQSLNKSLIPIPLDCFRSFQKQYRCWTYLQSTLTSILNQYPTTLEQDLQLVQYQFQDLSFNMQNCLRLRISEKDILKEHIDIAKQISELMADDCKKFQIRWKRGWGGNKIPGCDEYLGRVDSVLNNLRKAREEK